MRKSFISPLKYVQGEGEMSNLGTYVKDLGTKALVVTSASAQKRFQPAFDKVSCELVFGEFGGECSKVEIERLKALATEKGCDVVVGIGGGKTLDTAKAVAYYNKIPVIVSPTIASTDAPCSALTVIYTEKGEFEEYLFLPQNPNVVLIDTEVIAQAPVRFLVAGMGDALSTYFEARACERSFSNNFCGGKSTRTALAVARLCYETLLEDSLKAIASCKNKVVTPALESIIEANTLMSGLGFESSGLAGCHSVHNGLTVLPETHEYNHGEKVAFGVLVQLILENAPSEEISEILEYLKAVGLPTCLADLGIVEVTEEKIKKVAEAVCAPGETIHNMPFEVNAAMVYGAIMTANEIGQ